jgi:2-polyprenyl-3-methyl-5-hydroxy-6-metoxy-1,4-benzoquinol methylase
VRRAAASWTRRKKELTEDDVEVVRTGYDRAAESYSAGRNRFQNERYLDRLLRELPPPATILDVGCGSGNPIDRFLADHGYSILGIDISSRQIELARRLIPEGHFEVRNMLDLTPGEYEVDGIVSFYAIFHTPRDRHGELLMTLTSFLRSRGVMLITMGADEYEGREGDFHGVEMYWSHFTARTNRKLLEAAGLKMLLDEIDVGADERHQVLLATKD